MITKDQYEFIKKHYPARPMHKMPPGMVALMRELNLIQAGCHVTAVLTNREFERLMKEYEDSELPCTDQNDHGRL